MDHITRACIQQFSDILQYKWVVYNASNHEVLIPDPNLVRWDAEIIAIYSKLGFNSTQEWINAEKLLLNASEKSSACIVVYNDSLKCFDPVLTRIRNHILTQNEQELKYFNTLLGPEIQNLLGIKIYKATKTIIDPETNETREITRYYVKQKSPNRECVSVGTFLNIPIQHYINLFNMLSSLDYAFGDYVKGIGACEDMANNFWSALRELKNLIIKKNNALAQIKNIYNAEVNNFKSQNGCEEFPEFCNITIDENISPYLKTLSKGDLSNISIILYKYDRAINIYNKSYKKLVNFKKNVTKFIKYLQNLSDVRPPECINEDINLIDYKFYEGTPAEFCKNASTLYNQILVYKKPTKKYTYYKNLVLAMQAKHLMERFDHDSVQGAKEAIKRLRNTIFNELSKLSLTQHSKEQLKKDIATNRPTLGETYLYLKTFNVSIYKELSKSEIKLQDLIKKAKKDNVDVSLEESLFKSLNIQDYSYKSEIIQLINSIIEKTKNKYGYLKNKRELILKIGKASGYYEFVLNELKKIDGGTLDIVEDLGNLKYIDRAYDDLLNFLSQNLNSVIKYKISIPKQVTPNKKISATVTLRVCNPFNITLRNISAHIKPEFIELFGEIIKINRLEPFTCYTKVKELKITPLILRSIKREGYLKDNILHINEKASFIANYPIEEIILNNTIYKGPFEKGNLYEISWNYSHMVNTSLQYNGKNKTHRFAKFIWRWGNMTLMNVNYFNWSVLTPLPKKIHNGDTIELSIPDNNTTFMRLYNEISSMNLTQEEKIKLSESKTNKQLLKLKEEIIKRINRQKYLNNIKKEIKKEIQEWTNVLNNIDTPLAKKILQQYIQQLNYFLDNPEKYKINHDYLNSIIKKEAKKIYNLLKKTYKTPKATQYLNELLVNATAGDIKALSILELHAKDTFSYNKSIIEHYKNNYLPEYMSLTPKEVETKLSLIKEEWLFNKEKAFHELNRLYEEIKSQQQKAKTYIKLTLDKLEDRGADVRNAREALKTGNIKQAVALAKTIKPPKQTPRYKQEDEHSLIKIVLGSLIVGAVGLVYYIYNKKPPQPPKKLKSFKKE